MLDLERTSDNLPGMPVLQNVTDSGGVRLTTPKASAEPKRTMVMPFARALSLLAVFTPGAQWLSHREILDLTGLPATTVTRIAKSLVQLGYLHYDKAQHRFRLAASALALGYAAFAHSDVQQAARSRMNEFVERNLLHTVLSCRDRLDLIVLESCDSPKSQLGLRLHVGLRFGIASSPMGWALLAALPELERYYLLDKIERRSPRQWPALRRRCSEAISQVHEVGYCMSLGESDPGLAILAAPVWLDDHAPLVLACVGASAQLTRARVQREIGPQMLALADEMRQAGNVP